MTVRRTTAVIVAAGRGERLAGDEPKQFLALGGHPILLWSVATFSRHRQVDRVIVVLSPDRAASPPTWLPPGVTVVSGGETRAESVANGVEAAGATEVILIHDGVRPFATDRLIARVATAAVAGAVVPVVPLVDTIKVVDEAGVVVRTPPRERLRRAQTPQGFPADLLRRAHAAIGGGADLTDDALAVERAGIPVGTVVGETANLKITDASDLAYARWMVDTGLIPPPSLE